MPLIGPVSGSHTQLSDGSSFLVAGSNITISSGSGDNVTIAAASSTSPAGSDTQVQYNDGGSLAGDSGLTFNDSSNTLTVTNVSVTNASIANLIVSNAMSGSIIVPHSGDNEIQITSGSTEYNKHDTFFFVSGAMGSKNSSNKGVATFGGDMCVSGVVYTPVVTIGNSTAGAPITTALNVYANVSSDYAAKIDNDQSSAGHVLKL